MQIKAGQIEPLVAGADRISILLDKEQTSGQFSLVHREVAAGFQSPPQFHAHPDTDWLCYVLEGSLEFYYDNKSVICQKGDTVYIPRNTYFRWANTTEVTAQCLIFYTPGGFEGFFREIIPLMKLKSDRIGNYDKTLDDIRRVQDKYQMVRRP